jgi:UDP-2,3-diacylglucosamine pyrophosphatase LpxH
LDFNGANIKKKKNVNQSSFHIMKKKEKCVGDEKDFVVCGTTHQKRQTQIEEGKEKKNNQFKLK